MNIFSVSTPNLASNEDSLLSGSAPTPPEDGTPAGSFAAVLGASSPANPVVPAAVGKKRGSKGAPFASGPANGNVNAAQFQRSAKTASQAERPVQGEKAEIPGLPADIALETGETSEGGSEDHSIDANQRTGGQGILQNVQLNPLLLQQVVGEVPHAEIQSTATSSLSAPVDEVALIESSQDNLSEGISGVGRINRSSSPVAAQSRSIEFGAVAKPASGSAGPIEKTLSSDGAAAPMMGFPPVQGSKNTSLPESGNVGQKARNNFNAPRPETVGTAAVGTSGSSNNLNAPRSETVGAQTAPEQPSFNKDKSDLTKADTQTTASQTFRIGKGFPLSAVQHPDGPVIEQPQNLVENQVPLAQAAGTDSSVEVPSSPELLKHEALGVKGNFEFRAETRRVSEATAEVEQPEMSRPIATNGKLELRAETRGMAEIPVEVQQSEVVPEVVAAIGTPASLPEQAVALKGKLEAPKQTTGKSEIPVPAERPESSRITTRPSQNLASPPPQSIPRNLTRPPAIKSVVQLGIAARQTAGSIGPNVASEARTGQSNVSPTIVPRSPATVEQSEMPNNFSAVSKTEKANHVQNRTQPSSKAISSAESNLTAKEGSELGLNADAKVTTSVTSSLTPIAPKEKVVTISSKASNQIPQEKGLRRSELEASGSTPAEQPGAIPVGPNSRPIRATETPPKTLHEKEILGSNQTPRELSNPKVESGSALQARSETHSLRLAKGETELNGTTPAQVTDEMSSRERTSLFGARMSVALEKREQKQNDQSFVEARTEVTTETKARSATQASVILNAATERGTAQPLDSATASILKSSDQLNRDLLRTSEKVTVSSDAARSRNSDEREFNSMGQNKEEASGNFSGETILSANEPQEFFPEIRRGFEPADASGVLARARSRDLNSGDLPDLSPSSGGTIDAQHGSAMALRANSETGNTTFGKNIPSVGKNDSLLGFNEQIVSRSEMRSARSELSSQSVMDSSLLLNLSSTEVPKVSEQEIADFGEVGRVGQSRLAGEVWSAVEKFRATSHQDWVVSIRPDQDTHLNLKMKLEDNQLLIQATLESGNWDAVAPHWRELQAAFADRGVQLKALEAGTGPNLLSPQFNQAGSHGHEHRQAAADLAYAREFFEMNHGFTRGRAEPKKPAVSETPSRPNQVLETWA